MKGWGLLYALGASLLLHAGVLTTSWHWPSWLSVGEKSKPAQPSAETILIPVEIKHFYAEKKKEPEMAPALPEERPIAAGPGWMKKVAPAPLITDDVTYASFIRDLIQRELCYPAEMKGQGLEVTVRVVFTLNDKGGLLHLEVPPDLRSRYAIFNQAAMEAVRRAASQFPPFPAHVQKKDQRFSFLLLFRPDMEVFTLNGG